jgi:hypothetical protein
MWTQTPWPRLDWERIAVSLRMVETRPALNSTERAQKQVTKLGCLLETMDVSIDTSNDETKRVFYQVGRRRMSLEQGYKALERIAHAVESENQTSA